MPLEIPSLRGSALAGMAAPLAQFLERQFESGETVIWQGEPKPDPSCRRTFFRVGEIFIAGWLVVVVVIGLSGVGLKVWTNQWSDLARFTAIVLLMTGGGVAFRKLWKGISAAGRDCLYVLTDRRALVIAPNLLSGYSVRVFHPEELTAIKRTETRPDGSGSLIFCYDEKSGADGDVFPDARGFHDIAQVEMVERLIRQMKDRRPGLK